MAIFYNQATLSYNDTVTNSNIVTGEILEALTVSKTAVTDTYTAGDTVTYIVSIVNTGAAALTGVTVTDDLGAYEFNGMTLTPLEYTEGSVRLLINGVVQAAPEAEADPSLVISGITIPAGGNAVIVYETTVTEFADPRCGGEITNTATVTASRPAVSVTAEETVTADCDAALTITKSLSPEVIAPNGELTYTFTIQNFGTTPIVATDNAVVTDLFDPILDITSVTFNGATWTEPADYTYNEATGLFRTNIGEITVPAATYTQDPETGAWSVTPGVSVLRVTGTV